MAKHVKGSAIANASSYKLYLKDGTELATQTTNVGTGIDFDLSTISQLTAPGTYELGVKAISGDTTKFLDSLMSNIVSYIVEEAPVTPTNYTFTINPTPTSATVTLTASGHTQSGNSITVPNGTTVSWSVSASGYTTQTGTWTANGSNKTENVVLVASGGGGETAEWEIYSQDGAATVATDESGVPTVTGTQYKAAVLMKNTNSDFRFIAPAASAADGGRMVIIGRYGNNVLAFRPRGTGTGTQLQRYDYTTFGGAALTTDASALNTFAEGDTLEVVWSDNTASLYVNDTLQSSFDCSAYMSNETWQKCAGFMYTNLPKTTFTLNNFILL